MQKLRWMAAVAAAAVALGAVGCEPTAQSPSTSPPPAAPAPQPSPPQQGMSTRNKVLLLAGAAAVYYLYKKHQNAQGNGPNGRYFRSKNGRVYYRDMKTGEYHWVDPPAQPISVPAEDYQRYTGQPAPVSNATPIQQVPAGAQW